MAIRYDDYPLTLRERARFFLFGYGAAFLLLFLFYDSLALSLAGGMLSIFFLPFYRRHLGERRRRLLALQFKDFLYAVSSSIAAGRPMERALADAEETLSLIYAKEAPMCEELAYINRAMRDRKESEEELLRDLAERSGLEDIRNFVDVYALCRRLGGDLEEVIASTSRVMTDKMAILREIHTLTAQKQFEGRLISAMPLLVILGLNLFAPDYLAVLYTTLAGRAIMTVALGGIVTAFLLTQHLLDIRI